MAKPLLFRCFILMCSALFWASACHVQTQPTRMPASTYTLAEAAPIIHVATMSTSTLTPTATPTLTPTLTSAPTRTPVTLPAATPSMTPVWTATAVSPTIPARPATTIPTIQRPSASPTNTQLASAPTAHTLARTIQITGTLDALQREGQARWTAIGIECLDARGQVIARLPALAWQGAYALPLDTRLVRLWIGAELGGEAWWREWDAQPAGVADDPIHLRIGRLSSAPAPTSVPTAPPTAIPTTVPTAIPTAAPTAVPTAVPTYTPG